MGSETQEALEHAEHAHHAQHDPFDRRVAMTMAIVAAVLALVTMLSHRAHSETLRLSAEANRLQTEADIFHTQASDQWSFYQAKNIRTYEAQGLLRLLDLMAIRAPAGEVQQTSADWRAQVAKHEAELPTLRAKAEGLESRAHDLERQSGEKLEASEHVHHRASRFDLSELFTELALVLCSVAVLARRSEFWMFGVLTASLGAVIAGSAFLLG
jgi:hypothetical protein